MADQRDWDKELAKIDKLMAKGGGAPDPAPAPARADPPAERPAGETRPARPPRGEEARVAAAPRGRGALAVWLITLLGPIGVGALTIWPYPRDCGMFLWVYLVGVVAVLGAAIWAMRSAWTSRRGLPMVIGLATLLAGLVLLSAEVLPRVGYAAHSMTWTCST